MSDRSQKDLIDPCKLVDFLSSLRTVRFFKPEPLPEEVLKDVLNVARWTGSARNRQPWELVVVHDRHLLEMLAAFEGFAGHLANAALGIILVMAGEPEKFQQETFDEGRLAERISLAAASHGVASSVGWFKGGGREKAKKLLGIPTGRLVRTALSLGYPAHPPSGARSALPKGRKPLSGLVHEDRYGRAWIARTGSERSYECRSSCENREHKSALEGSEDMSVGSVGEVEPLLHGRQDGRVGETPDAHRYHQGKNPGYNVPPQRSLRLIANLHCPCST